MIWPGNTLLLGAAIMFLFFAVLMLIPVIAVNRHQKKCRIKVKGKCIAVTDPNWPEDMPNAPYMPTYEIHYKGQVIQITRTVGKMDNRVEVEKEYDLYIDPDNPQNFINPEDNEEHLGRVRFCIGCFVGFAAMLAFYITTIFLTN